MRKQMLMMSLLLVTFSVSVVCPVFARTYVWVDQAGQTRKTSNRPKDHQVSKWISVPGSTQKKSQHKVELYVTSWCPYCHKAADYFRARKIPFTIYNVEKDKNAAARKRRLSGGKGGVPFAVVNGVAIHGYNPARYGQALQ